MGKKITTESEINITMGGETLKMQKDKKDHFLNASIRHVNKQEA